MGCITAKAERIGGGLQVKAIRMGDGLKITVGLVCSIGNPYLEVTPDTVWVSPEIIREILVKSNTGWIIR